MKSRRFVSEEDAKYFFDISINTIDKAIGTAILNLMNKEITFDDNAVKLLQEEDLFADKVYNLDTDFFVPELNEVFTTIMEMEITPQSELEFVRKSGVEYHFVVKITKRNDNELELSLICVEKLLETEEQMKLFSTVVGSGLSMFKGSTFWIDYDRYEDYFYSSPVGPEIMGIPVEENMLYSTELFLTFRDKAKLVSEAYHSSIEQEQTAYDNIYLNTTDFLAGRTPVVTNEDKIIWVETYGKCILRYPDGTPRFFVAIDIYLSDIYEEKTQLELLTQLIDYGLINSEVGIWYYQKHFLEGKYYFTDSYQKLMSDTHNYKDENITDILNHQISLMERDQKGMEKHLHSFRKVHNSIFTEKTDKYHVVIPNYKNNFMFNWIEVRGTVIERDENGEVLLFVGVNVDVTKSYLRNQELERLRIQNEQLQFAEKLAIKARNLMIWYHYIDKNSGKIDIYGNEIFTEKLGMPRSKDGLIRVSDIRRSIVRDDVQSKENFKRLRRYIRDITVGEKDYDARVVIKHRNLRTGDILYIEHSMEVSKNEDDSTNIIGGVMIDVTDSIRNRKKIEYLANYDTLTDVNNRNYFERYIANDLPSDYTIMVFDLDGLKLVNDVFGHIKGDSLITEMAKILKKVFDDAEFIARIGGDEFSIITKNIKHEVIAQQFDVFYKTVEEFNKTSEIELNVSSGSNTVINSHTSFDKAFVRAENIMYRGKLNNRSSRKSKVLESILETLNAKTEETKEHSDRIATLAVKTMKGMGFSRYNEIEDIKLLAKVHDIGKITIDDHILKKETKLTKSEYEIIKKHCEAGYKIIRNITDSDDVCNGVLLHHERYDGKGYPQGLKGKNIPIFARIIGVVDAFDAMTHDRVYRNLISQEEAIQEIIKNSGTQFDPDVVRVFLKSCFDIELK